MNLTMIKTLLTSKEEYSEPKTIEMLSSIPFIFSFLKQNGKEYLHALLTMCSLLIFNEGESFDSIPSESILLYLTGSIRIVNHLNNEEIAKEHISFGLPVISSQKHRLYSKIAIKMITQSSFISIPRSAYDSLHETISIKKTQKITKFTSTIKALKLFHNVKKGLYEKLYQISKEIKYKRKDIVYEETDEVDGIYFITEGSFLLTKRQPSETQEEELKKIDRELEYLSKEGELYLKCLNNKFSTDSREMTQMRYMLKQSSCSNRNSGDTAKAIITKRQSSIMNLTILNDNNIFGDIELVSKERTRSYGVQCKSEVGKVIYFPRDKFKEVCTDSMMEKIHFEVLKKAKLFSRQYHSDVKIAESKLLLEKYGKIPIDLNKIHIKRNFIEELRSHKDVKTAFKMYRTSAAKFKLPHVPQVALTKTNILTTKRYSSMEKELSLNHLKANSLVNDTTFLLKKKYEKINSDNQLGNIAQTETNQTPSTFACVNSYALKLSYKDTKMKYPNSLPVNKRKLSFNFLNKKTNLKKVLLSNNLSEVEFLFKHK